jgi:hypothetical protein
VVAVELYPIDPGLGDILKREAARLEDLISNRACIETDHPELPADDAPASAFISWRGHVWGEAPPLAHAIARADQLLGRTQLLACFEPKEHFQRWK